MDLELRVPLSYGRLWNVVLKRVMHRSIERVRQGLPGVDDVEEAVYDAMCYLVDWWSMSGMVMMCERCWHGVGGMFAVRPPYDAFLCHTCRRFEMQWRYAHECGIEFVVYVGEDVVWKGHVSDVMLEMLDQMYASCARPMLPRLPVVCQRVRSRRGLLEMAVPSLCITLRL